MKHNRSLLRTLAAAIGMTALLAAPAVFAQPDRHHGQEPRYQPPKYSAHQGGPRHESRHAPRYEKHYAHKVDRRGPPRHVYHTPPRDMRFVRNDIRPYGHAIRRGPALPPHYQLVRGRPLPPGYGHVVSYEHHHYLPHYAGYEWRSVGRDLVLVAATTGLVYAIVDNILN